jgi:hypothetical protein
MINSPSILSRDEVGHEKRLQLPLSKLPHTWIIDLDGTVLKHNGHLLGGDSLLPGVQAFWNQLPKCDIIVLMSAREEYYRDSTLDYLRTAGLRFDFALFGMPKGERILMNDSKPLGLRTAIGINLVRDSGLEAIQLEELFE